jgi:DNA polymerase III epsilon subunit-like protein
MNVQALKKELQDYKLVDCTNLKKPDITKLLETIKTYKKTAWLNGVWQSNCNISADQNNIVMCDKKYNIRVIAAAGSGKTTTILCRIKYLIDTGTDPSRIILCAFNVDAAKDMKAKLSNLFGFTPRIMIGTIDSIACRFYNQYFKKNYYVSVSEYSLEFLKYLQSPEGINILNNYDYFFFDEFQDANQTQYNILKCFYNNGTKVTVIGDDSQNIYQFRGSNVKFIIEFDRYFHNLKTFKLLSNYRSTPDIINLANKSISFNTKQIKKEMIATKNTLYVKPAIKHYAKQAEEMEDIVIKIKDYKAKGHNFSDMAIISRNNYFLKYIEEKLEKHNSKNEKIGYVSLLFDQAVKKQENENDKLTLTTIHKSKGLEWNIVFLVGCDDYSFPSNKDNLSIEEERRLFYVAVTRAKTYLHISFRGVSKKDKNIYITRFIQEIPKSFYEFPNYKNEFYKTIDYTKKYFEESVHKIIKTLNEHEISQLRQDKLIPEQNVNDESIYHPITVNQTILNNNWFLDYNEFIKTILKREILIKNNQKPTDYYAVNTIYPIIIPNKTDYNTFNRYIKDKKNNIPTTYILKVLEQIKAHSVKYNLPIENIIVARKKFISEKLETKLQASYDIFSDINAKTEEIISDIYTISLSQSIYYGRRRLLYNDLSQTIFKENFDLILPKLRTYAQTIEGNLTFAKLCYNTQYSLSCEIDMIYNDKLTLFKGSNDSNFKLEWLLEIIGCYCLYEKDNIKTLEIFNVSRGLSYKFNVSDIIFPDYKPLFLQFICTVRNKKQKAEDTNLCEILTDDDLTNVLLENNKWLVEGYLDTLSKSQDEKQIESYNALLLRYYNTYKKITVNNDIMYQITKTFNFKYIVFDTETTGLPQMINYQTFPKYDYLKGYDTARLIQLSWGIYNADDSLLSIENVHVKPNNFTINNSHIHGITNEIAAEKGIPVEEALCKFVEAINREDVMYIVCHNISFDVNIIKSELYRLYKKGYLDVFAKKKLICTLAQANKMKSDGLIPNAKLGTVYQHFYNEDIKNAHNAEYDVLNTGKVFHKMRELGLIVL